MNHRPTLSDGLPLYLLVVGLIEAWDSRERCSLRERMTRLQNARGLSVLLLCVYAAVLISHVGLNAGLTLEQSYVAGGLGALAMGFWATRFMSRPQSKAWRRLLQAAMGKVAAFVVGGFLTAVALVPFEETHLTQITCLVGGMIFALGPVKAFARNANHAG